MDALFKIGLVDVALRVFKETQDPNFLTFSTAISNLCKLSDLMNMLAEALQLLGLMITLGIPTSVSVWSILIDGYCKFDNLVIERVLKVPSTYNIILERVWLHAMRSVASTYHQALRFPNETSAIEEVLGDQIMSKQCFVTVSGSRAVKEFVQMVEEPESNELFVDVGKAAEQKAVEDLVESWLSDGIWRKRKLDQQDYTRRLFRARTTGYLLEKMIEAGCSPNVVTCTSLIKGFMDSQKPGKALCILSTMESKGCSTDLVLCNVLIDCLSKMGRCDDALDVFFSLPKRKLVPDSYTLCSIMSALFMSRQFDLLPILISGLDIQADLVVCNSLLSYFCRAGYPSGADEFYNDMIERGFIPDGYSYSGLLSGLCGTGRIGEAVKVYYAIVRNNFCLDPHIHTTIIDGLISSGKFHRAIRLFRKAVAEKYPLDVVSYAVAIQGLFRGGRTGDACILYNQMKEVGVAPNACTYNVMLSGFCRERDIEMVRQILQDMVDSGANLVDVLEVDTSGSDDICDVAASVG
ncbi:putative pentatricopeptide repeat-containing protein At1g16830 [Camellia sinensis]|uniref:putative pentatricopeptide repeat-containing protein At1g16830 n=1 Tax=Camellia sinensis TaxID=4442 RepID=UPI001035F5F0|nr:putative pentatricopeptide repeat-containing protein At1g16830 [Camellia sinensis]